MCLIHFGDDLLHRSMPAHGVELAACRGFAARDAALRMMRSILTVGSGTDRAEQRFGIGVERLLKISSVVPYSGMLPRYITTVSEMCLTTDRS